MPGPARRLLRNRPRLVAVALLAVTVIAASVLQSTAATVLQQTLDENWRGAYDILVTQAGKPPDSNGFLRSDALTDATTGRLSFDDLERIRALPGVDVAAPIAEVAFADSSLTGEAVLWLPVPVRADASLESPQAFRITVSGTTNDGLADRDLAVESVFAFAYQPSFSQIVFDATGAPLLDENGQVVYATTELADSPRLLTADARLPFVAGAWDPDTGTIALGLVVAPRPAARIVLVDPVAERELLGEAGAFLDPLDRRPALQEPGDANPIVRLSRDEPLVRSRVTLEEYDDVQPGAAGARGGRAGAGHRVPAERPARAADRRRLGDARHLDLPGGHRPTSTDRSTSAPERARRPRPRTGAGGERRGRARRPRPAPRSIVAGRYIVPEDGTATGIGFALQPARLRDVRAVRGGAHLGRCLTRLGRDVQQAVRLGGRRDAAGRPRAVRGRRRVLGGCPALESRRSELHAPRLVRRDEPVTRRAGPRRLATSTTGFGIPAPTSSRSAASTCSTDGTSSGRSRRSGSVSRARRATAQRRSSCCCRPCRRSAAWATPRRSSPGSSPQRVPVTIEDYAFSAVDDEGNQVVGTLGIVEQSWSRLGAVVEAEVGISATGVALLAISVVSVGVLLAVVQLGSVPARRRRPACCGSSVGAVAGSLAGSSPKRRSRSPWRPSWASSRWPSRRCGRSRPSPSRCRCCSWW